MNRDGKERSNVLTEYTSLYEITTGDLFATDPLDDGPTLTKLPPLMPITAPTTIGKTSKFRFALFAQPVRYGVHWPMKGTKPVPFADGEPRKRCTGRKCPFCMSGFKRQIFVAATVLDRDKDRLVVISMSEAVWDAVFDACRAYVEDLRVSAVEPGLLYLDHPVSPTIAVEAARTSFGPRYRATASLQDYGADPKTGITLGFEAYRRTEQGAAWLQEVLARTSSRILLGGTDPMKIIWPDDPD